MGDFPIDPKDQKYTEEFEKYEKDRGVDPKTGLFGHARNCFIALGDFSMNCNSPKYANVYFDLVTAKPLLNYEATVRQLVSKDLKIQEILTDSDPKKVEEFNKLVDEFNRELERIRADINYAKVKIPEIWGKADALFKQK